MIIVLGIYFFALLFLFCYSLIQAHLAYHYSTFHKNNQPGEELFADARPFVTIQLPVYNEQYVVERLIKAVAQFDYPREKYEIQVLDDSDDETVGIIHQCVTHFHGLGINIDHVRRTSRDGFKAGALQNGLATAKGELIAIFDADFIPQQDFLLKTIPHFSANQELGAIQTKWGYTNRDYSLLTRIQAFGLDAHFTLEQTGRNSAGYFMNFNGTAGMWRKECINDAGGWQADTLTEDLDLSYRAQLKGWKFKYLEAVISPGELPVAMSALRSQQYRWTKGAAETARKNLGAVLKAEIPFLKKVHAFFHLLNSLVFLFITLTALMSVPLLFIKNSTPQLLWVFRLASIFLLSFLVLIVFYAISCTYKKKSRAATSISFIRNFFLFASVSMGLSLHNTIAALEGYIGKKSAFIRTPKFNILQKYDQWKNNKYLSVKLSWLTIVEAILVFYFLFGIVSAFYLEDYGLLPFHLMLFTGFLVIVSYSLLHSKPVHE